MVDSTRAAQNSSMTRARDASGRVTMESLIELVVALMIAPTIVCCLVQAAAMLLAMVVPWVAVVVVAVGVAACLGAGLAARRRMGPPIRHGNLPMRVPPVRRPAGIPDRRHEHRDY